MARTVLVHQPKIEFLFAWLAAAALVVGGVLSLKAQLDKSSNGRIVLAATAVAVGTFATGWWFARRERCLLTDTGSGFVCDIGNRVVEFGDNEVVGIGSRVLVEYASGVPVSAARVGIIATHEPTLPEIKIRYSFEPEEDPLDSLFGRLTDHVRQDALATFIAGGEIRGSGWRLSAEGLRVWVMGTERNVPFAHLVTAEVVDRHACVWGSDEPEPLVRVPEESLNAAVLVGIVGTNDSEPEPQGGFGRLLFEGERRWSVSSLSLWWLATLALWGASSAALINGRTPGTLAFGALAAFLGVTLPLAWFLSRRTVLRAYTNGLRMVQPLGEREISFDEVVSFTYSVVRHYVTTNDVTSYVGTFVVFRLVSQSRGALCYEFSTLSRDSAVEAVRDRIARRLAAEWRRQVIDKKLRDWCGGAVFTYKGLCVPGRHGFVPYKQIADCTVRDGVCRIQHVDRTDLVTLLCSAPDFYPGLELLNQFRADSAD